MEYSTHSFLNDFFDGQNFSRQSLAGDASSRRYDRLKGKEKSLILMTDNPFHLEDSSFLHIQKCLQKNDVSVPEVLHTSPDEGLMFLEDLSDLTLEDVFWEDQKEGSTNNSNLFYKKSIDELIKIHKISQEENSSCIAFQLSFDQEKLIWEFNHSLTYFLQGFCEIHFSEKDLKELQNTFSKISETLANEPQVVCHRDYHSRNLMIKSNKVYVIDFQDARLGPVQYDLVSLLKDSYTDLSKDQQKQLLQYYLMQRNLAFDDHFEFIYKLQTAQRTFKACGSFASFYEQKGDTRYLKYIAKTVDHTVNALKDFPEFSFFHKLLSEKPFYKKQDSIKGLEL